MDDSYYEGTVSETEDFSPYPLEGETDGPSDSDSGSAWTDTVIDYRPQLNMIQESLTVFQDHMTRPLMTTPFEEYTVSEGLILLLLAFLILQSLIKIVKVGFSWLLW